MQKLESYLFDLIGMFFPGLVLWGSLIGSYSLLISWKAHQKMASFAQGDESVIQQLFDRAGDNGIFNKSLLWAGLVFAIVLCYLTGLFLSGLSHWLMGKWPFKRKLHLYFPEHDDLLDEVHRLMRSQLKVDVHQIKPRMGWRPYYRWASHLSSFRGWKPMLEHYVYRCNMYRSLTAVFLLLIVGSAVFQLMQMGCSYYVPVKMHWVTFAVLIAVSIVGLRISYSAFRDYHRLIGSESLMVLHTHFTSPEPAAVTPGAAAEER
ncbi:hypothetical protein ACFFSY_00545 [Paenibacillus aurantiacus]|uniref:Uncharacterized protein n=1 Tax=Paenibacillus aurantiacus TaxID=1936118 RepID=A0ABV5KGS7_9BACL